MTADPLSMSIEGREVRLIETADGTLHVVSAKGESLGTLFPAIDGTSYSVRDSAGEPLRTPSRWGGEVTSRFATRTLALTALLARGRDASSPPGPPAQRGE